MVKARGVETRKGWKYVALELSLGRKCVFLRGFGGCFLVWGLLDFFKLFEMFAFFGLVWFFVGFFGVVFFFFQYLNHYLKVQVNWE